MINKEIAKQMRAYLEVALTGFEEHFDVACKIGSIRFSENQAQIKLEANAVSDSGEVFSKEHENFKNHAKSYGLKPEWLGKSFSSRLKTFTITGLNTRAKKYKVLAQEESGSTYKFNHLEVKRLMEETEAI